MTLSKKVNTVINIKECLEKAVDAMEVAYAQGEGTPLSYKAISTGFHELDELTGGLGPGFYVVSGAHESNHSQLLYNILESASFMQDLPILHFEFDISLKELTLKTLSSLGKVSYPAIRTGKLNDEDWARLSACIKLSVEKSKFNAVDCAGLSVEKVNDLINAFIAEHGNVGLISLNSLQSIKTAEKFESRYQEISYISKKLKEISKLYEIPVVVTSTLSMNLEQRADKRPIILDLSDTGTLEYDADVVMFVYRDEIYNTDSKDKGKAEVILGVNKFGSLDRIKLVYEDGYF